MMLEIPIQWQPDTLQINFKSVLEAMSRPGSVQPILHSASSVGVIEAVMATLLDGSVSFADPHLLLTQETRQFSQAREVSAEDADYLVWPGELAPAFLPKLGTLDSPEKSATVVLRVNSLNQGHSFGFLSGPGIEKRIACSIDGLHEDWVHQRQQWNREFPMGVDIIFVDSSGVMAWPRTSRWELF